MDCSTYNIGDSIRVTATFTNIVGTVMDPTAVVFRLRDPIGNVTLPAPITRVSTGVYYVDVPVTAKGSWRYRWEGTGAVTAAEEGRFDVRPSFFV